METNVEEGSAVMAGSSGVVGIVTSIDRSRGVVWVAWPDNCGMANSMALINVHVVAPRAEIMQAVQAIAPRAMLASPFERALIGPDGQYGSVVVIDQK